MPKADSEPPFQGCLLTGAVDSVKAALAANSYQRWPRPPRAFPRTDFSAGPGMGKRLKPQVDVPAKILPPEIIGSTCPLLALGVAERNKG